MVLQGLLVCDVQFFDYDSMENIYIFAAHVVNAWGERQSLSGGGFRLSGILNSSIKYCRREWIG